MRPGVKLGVIVEGKEEMSDHSESGEASRHLCNALSRELQQRIPFLRRVQSARWCGFFQEGRKRFAYVNHRKQMSRIEVWCLGDPEALAKESRLTVKERSPTSGGFGREFRARFFVDELSDVVSAAEALVSVSYERTA